MTQKFAKPVPLREQSPGRRSAAEAIFLQRTLGNRAVTRLFTQASGLLQRQPDDAAKTKKQAAETPTGRQQHLFLVRDKGFSLGGGTLVQDLSELKTNLLSIKETGEWTLVLAIHGGKDRLGAQSPPNWQDNAVFYEAKDIETLFNGDRRFVEWRKSYGPVGLSLVACQVSKSFEGVILANLTRAGSAGSQPARGLGEGCKPIARSVTFDAAPPSRAEFEKLPASRRDPILRQLKVLNETWGYYGASPVRDDQIVHFYYDEEPKRAWVKVEVMVGKGHTVEELTATGIPYWNRTTGPDSVRFRELCDQGAAPWRDHVPEVPDVP